MKQPSQPSPSIRRLLVGGLLLFGAACAVNPVTGRRELSLVSESQEILMGQQGAQDVDASIGLAADSASQQYVRGIGLRLAAASERPQLPWSFKVLDDPAVNAFALPGGFIYVTRGILAHLKDEAELASVIGHEIGHVTAKHSVQAISRQQITQVGLGVGSILSDEVAQIGGAASVGLGVLFLKYGRAAEEQADELGFKYALNDGYDVRAMSQVFLTLQRVSNQGGAGRLPQWLSSHPEPGNRYEKNEARVAALTRDLSTAALNRDAYARTIDGIVYGVNPRQGYFVGARFNHPDLRFQLDFPSGWKTQNQAQAVVGVSASDDAILALSISAGAAGASAAYTAFAGQQGVTAGTPSSVRIHGNPAVVGTFDATTQQGALRGEVTFVEYGGRVYRVLAYGTTSGFAAHASALRIAAASFAQLTDRTALNKQPMRLRSERLSRDITVEEFHRTRSPAIPIAELLLINGVEAGATLSAGSWAKRVEP